MFCMIYRCIVRHICARQRERYAQITGVVSLFVVKVLLDCKVIDVKQNSTSLLCCILCMFLLPATTHEDFTLPLAWHGLNLLHKTKKTLPSIKSNNNTQRPITTTTPYGRSPLDLPLHTPTTINITHSKRHLILSVLSHDGC